MNELSPPWKSRNRQTKQRLTKVQPQCVIRSRLRGETSDSELRHKLQILDLKALTGSKSLISFEGEGGERGGGYSRGTGHTGNSDQLLFNSGDTWEARI